MGWRDGCNMFILSNLRTNGKNMWSFRNLPRGLVVFLHQKKNTRMCECGNARMRK